MKRPRKKPKNAPGRMKPLTGAVWFVCGPEGLVEASHDKKLLPDCGIGEKLVKVMVVLNK